MEKKLTALLVDDDKFLLDMYSLKFEKNGVDVTTACGADEALEKMREGVEPDIIVLDIVMPNMDGIELLGVMRKESLAMNSVIIMLTNQSQAIDMERAKELNVDGYIVKASTVPSEVLEKVMGIYNKHKGRKS